MLLMTFYIIIGIIGIMFAKNVLEFYEHVFSLAKGKEPLATKNERLLIFQLCGVHMLYTQFNILMYI